MSVPIEAQLAELKRERKMRESAYPRFIERGSLKPEAAKRQIEALDAAIETIEKMAQTERLF